MIESTNSNYITFENDWTHPVAVSEFLRKLSVALRMGYTDIILDLNSVSQVYPCVCVPISGAIQYHKKNGIHFQFDYPEKHYLVVTHFEDPYSVAEHQDSLSYPLNKVWRFSTISEITLLLNAYLAELRNTDVCKLGIIDGLTWSLNETMDNVLQHSLCDEGFIMGVIHSKNKILSFTVYDYGQGIFNSLKNSEFHPRNSADAISIAIQEGKTRDKSIGQGNGLWGLNNIIIKNRGQLTITSHGASLMTKARGDQKRFEHLPFLTPANPSTVVDFVLNYNNPISISEALGGYTPLNFHLENLENEKGDVVFTLSEQATGYGTRIAGERARNNVINIIEESGANNIIQIDFSDISIISSSFADEFIGKLLATLGFFKFSRLIKMVNMNDVIEVIINRSVGQRMATEYATNSIDTVVSDF